MPSNSPIPPTMRVAVEVGFVQSCSECVSIVRGLADAALVDTTVTRFAALPGRKHACGRTEPAALPRGTSAPPAKLPSGELFASPGTNGFDPEPRA